MILEKNKIIEKTICCFLILFCLINLFGFNYEHIDASIVYRNIVVPYININVALILAFLSVFVFILFLFLKKIKIDKIAVLLLLRICLYIIPIVYIDDGVFKIGVLYAIIQCFFSFVIGSNSEKIDFKIIVKILAFFLAMIVVEQLYTLYVYNISLFSSNLKWFMILPLGRNNYIACLLIPTYGLVYNYSNNSFFKLFISILVIVGVVATGSRLALIIIICYIIFLILKKFNFKGSIKRKKALKYFFLFSCLFIMIVSFYKKGYLDINSLMSRFTSTSLSENRIRVYRDSFNVFLNHPILGRSAYSFQVYDAVRTHNFVLESLVQTGICGTILFLYILYLIFYKLNRIEEKSIKVAIKNFVVLWLIQGMMEPNMFSTGSDFYFWFIVGIGVSYSGEKRVRCFK